MASTAMVAARAGARDRTTPPPMSIWASSQPPKIRVRVGVGGHRQGPDGRIAGRFGRDWRLAHITTSCDN